jgi:eukaryotic-like serine/threonine-protein kinase
VGQQQPRLPSGAVGGPLVAARGQAYLRLGMGSEAAAEFQRILAARGQAPLSVLYRLAQRGSAQALGDVSKARDQYRAFFAMWKDADADLPVLVDAKKSAAREPARSTGG